MDAHAPRATRPTPPAEPLHDEGLPPEVREIQALLAESAALVAELERRRAKPPSIAASASTSA
jgi:hypothetical protein